MIAAMNGSIDDPLLAAAEEIWTTAEGFADALSAAESAVVRWAWFSDSWCCSPEPFVAQRNGYAPGRELRGEPDLTSASAARCGFDDSNRAVVSCWHPNAGHGVTYTVRFFEDSRCRELAFERDELLAVALYEYDQDVLVRRAAMGRPAGGRSRPRGSCRSTSTEMMSASTGFAAEAGTTLIPPRRAAFPPSAGPRRSNMTTMAGCRASPRAATCRTPSRMSSTSGARRRHRPPAAGPRSRTSSRPLSRMP